MAIAGSAGPASASHKAGKTLHREAQLPDRYRVQGSSITRMASDKPRDRSVVVDLGVFDLGYIALAPLISKHTPSPHPTTNISYPPKVWSTHRRPPKMGRNYKTRVYLEPPIPGSATVRTRVTRIIPPAIEVPAPPPPVIIEVPDPAPPPPVVIEAPPPPPPALLEPEPEPEPEPDFIDVIAVDVEPARKPKSKGSSRRRSHSRRGSRDREREVIIEREKIVPVPVRVPVPVPVRVQPEYETYRYVEGPRRRSPPRALPAPPEEEQRVRITIQDQRRTREYQRY